MVMSRLGSTESRYSSWATSRLAMSSSTAPPRRTMRCMEGKQCRSNTDGHGANVRRIQQAPRSVAEPRVLLHRCGSSSPAGTAERRRPGNAQSPEGWGEVAPGTPQVGEGRGSSPRACSDADGRVREGVSSPQVTGNRFAIPYTSDWCARPIRYAFAQAARSGKSHHQTPEPRHAVPCRSVPYTSLRVCIFNLSVLLSLLDLGRRHPQLGPRHHPAPAACSRPRS